MLEDRNIRGLRKLDDTPIYEVTYARYLPSVGVPFYALPASALQIAYSRLGDGISVYRYRRQGVEWDDTGVWRALFEHCGDPLVIFYPTVRGSSPVLYRLFKDRSRLADSVKSREEERKDKVPGEGMLVHTDKGVRHICEGCPRIFARLSGKCFPGEPQCTDYLDTRTKPR